MRKRERGRQEKGKIHNFKEEGEEKKRGLWGEKRFRLQGLWMNVTDRWVAKHHSVFLRWIILVSDWRVDNFVSIYIYVHICIHIHNVWNTIKEKVIWKQPETSHAVFSSLVTCVFRNLLLEALILQRLMSMLMLYFGPPLHSLWLQCVVYMVKHICKLLQDTGL